MEVSGEMMSESQKQIYNHVYQTNKIKDSSQKLLGTLYNKKNYTAHYKNLIFGIKHGLRITKIHKALVFSEMNFLKTWVDKNTALRILASEKNDPAGKQFVKLLLNSLYGKAIERVEERADFKFVSSSEDTFLKNESIFVEGYKIINENLTLFKSKKKKFC